MYPHLNGRQRRARADWRTGNRLVHKASRAPRPLTGTDVSETLRLCRGSQRWIDLAVHRESIVTKWIGPSSSGAALAVFIALQGCPDQSFNSRSVVSGQFKFRAIIEYHGIFAFVPGPQFLDPLGIHQGGAVNSHKSG